MQPAVDRGKCSLVDSSRRPSTTIPFSIGRRQPNCSFLFYNGRRRHTTLFVLVDARQCCRRRSTLLMPADEATSILTAFFIMPNKTKPQEKFFHDYIQRIAPAHRVFLHVRVQEFGNFFCSSRNWTADLFSNKQTLHFTFPNLSNIFSPFRFIFHFYLSSEVLSNRSG